MAKDCKRCNRPIVWNAPPLVTGHDIELRRWQEKIQDYHSSSDECIRAMSKYIDRIEERLTGLEKRHQVSLLDLVTDGHGPGGSAET